jgi:hypothetical protein
VEALAGHAGVRLTGELSGAGLAGFSGDAPFGQSLAPVATALWSLAGLLLSSFSVGHALACYGEQRSPRLFSGQAKACPTKSCAGNVFCNHQGERDRQGALGQ